MRFIMSLIIDPDITDTFIDSMIANADTVIDSLILYTR